VSSPTAEDDLVEVAIGEILASAAVARADGRLTPGFEDELARRFDSIAADPRALQRAVEAGARSARQLYRFPSEAVPSRSDVQPESDRQGGVPRALATAAGRSARAAKGVSRKGVTTARRVAGPGLRSLERRMIDHVGGAAEALATRGHVVSDHARRVASSGGTSRRYVRLSPSGRALPPGPAGKGTGASSTVLGAGSLDPVVLALEEWTIERMGRGPGGCVLHVECGAGALVRRLSEAGFGAVGADPTTEVESDTITRAGAVERIGAQRRSSLGGLVLSGVTERVSPGSARALVHLSSTRLSRGGIAVLVSAHPGLDDRDPITLDLALRRPLHPVTWCHLLARYGFREITVLDPGAEDRSSDHGAHSSRSSDSGALYAIGARRQ
jgi:hypothetical protein